jgi:F420H(2)-dependent quinone reductase
MASAPRQRDRQRLLVRLSTKLNPIVSAILRSRLHWLLSPGLMLITVTGRKSGRRFTIPVGYHRSGNVVTILIADAPSKVWWRNYRTPGPIELRLRGRALRGEAQLLPAGSEEFRARAEASFARSAAIARIFGVRYDARLGLSAEQLSDLADQAAIVRVTLADER